MDKTPALMSVAVLAMVSAVLVPREHPESRQASTATQKEAGKEHEAPPPSAGAVPDDPFEALNALAESFGIDVSAAGLRRMAERENRIIVELTASPERRSEAKALRHKFREIARARFDQLPEVTKHCRSLASTPPPPLKSDGAPEIQAASQRPFDTDFFKLVSCFFEQKPLDTSALKLAVLRQTAKRQDVDVNFLIALLPDPIDSFTGWQFDPMLDAISQAVAASDYIFERTHFPDAEAGHRDGPAGRAHEIESSVVLYGRRPKPVDGDDAGEAPGRSRHERLMVLIIHENPSAGVHIQALINALRLVTGWSGKTPRGEDATIRILGPTFSGSADSIARGLRQADRRQILGDYSVRFITGSATDDANKQLIESALADPCELADVTHVSMRRVDSCKPTRISFHATVQPDSLLLPQLARQISAAGWPRPIAVLFEGNTQYGRSLLDELHDPSTFGRSDLILLPFSMNISRIRNRVDDEKRGLGDVLGMPAKFRRLEMDTAGKPADQIPQLSPSTTASYVELALSGMLRTMSTERVRTVALMATDARDKLFLARQISRYSPNVSMFTVESDSLYLHPDYSSYLQGALVASTYPLYSGNQRWSYGFEGGTERREFANGSALGIYNAALALLNYGDDGRPLPSLKVQGRIPPSLIEYGVPGDDCIGGCAPPVWISVVGRNSAWPVRAYPIEASDYVFRPLVGRVRSTAGLATFPSPAFIAVFVVFTAGLLLCWASARSASSSLAGAVRERFVTLVDGPDQSRGRAYMLVGVMSLFLIELFLLAVAVARLRIDPVDSRWTQFWTWTAVVSALAALAALVDIAACLATYMTAHDRRHLRRRFHLATRGGWSRLAGMLFCGWAAGSLMWYVWNHALDSPYAAVGFVTRATDLGSGVSPTLPVLCLGAAITLWSLAELARLRSPKVALADPHVCALMHQTVSGGLEHLSRSWALLNRSTLAVPVWLSAFAVAMIAATCFFLFDPFVRPLVTIEGRWFGRFVSSGLLIVQVMISLSLLQFLYLWAVLRRLLERMAWHKAAAYETVPRALYPPGLFPRVPRLMELQPLTGQVAEVFHEDMKADPHQLWSTSRTWKAILDATDPPPAGQPASRKAAAIRQRLVEMASALVVRDALARLQHNLVFVIGGVLLVFCSHTLFPFQLNTFLAQLGWMYIALTFGAILVVLVQMKRSEVLRRLTAAEPGSPGRWDSAFVWRVVVFALLPLLTLFAAQFPDIGGVLLQWAGSARSALP